MTHLARTVPESALRERGAEQVPFFDLATEDFPLALLRGGKGLPSGGWRAAESPARRYGDSYQVTLTGEGTIVQGKRNVVATSGGDVEGGINTARPGETSWARNQSKHYRACPRASF